MGKVNAKNKKASVTMLMPDKIDFGKTKKDRLWDKESCQRYAGKCPDDERVISSKHKKHACVCLSNSVSKCVRQKWTELQGD